MDIVLTAGWDQSISRDIVSRALTLMMVSTLMRANSSLPRSIRVAISLRDFFATALSSKG